MSRKGKPYAALVITLLISCLFHHCRSKTDREIIAALIDKMAAQVEKRDAAGLMAHLAESYIDFEGRDRAKTAAMVEDYFSRYRGIVVKVLASRIELRTPLKAEVETDVAFYSGAASAFRKLVGFSGESYRFRFAMQKTGAWKILTAQWEYIPLSGLFPESLKILREMFPNL
jgi:ketosteroid isomerase-like protein